MREKEEEREEMTKNNFLTRVGGGRELNCPKIIIHARPLIYIIVTSESAPVRVMDPDPVNLDRS